MGDDGAVDLNHLSLRVADPVACRDFSVRHFGFRPAFEAEGGFFVRNDERFLLALVPAEAPAPLPAGVHIGFGLDDAAAVVALHDELTAAGVAATAISDERPRSDYVTFRSWDPDGTEIEVFWEA
jgi:catechol 2,3-dioxygenase-like lactoylglutathione lyase family enzyme